MTMPMISITGMASTIDSGTEYSISTAPKSPNQVCASGVRTSSGAPQGDSCVGSTVTVSMRDQLAERHRAEGAEHEQRAMGEVDDAQRAENQGQAQGDQRIGPAFVQAVEKLCEDGVHEPTGRSRGKRAGARPWWPDPA